VRLHDGLYLSQQHGVLVFGFWLASGADVIDAGNACLIFMNAQFNGFSIPAEHFLRHTSLPIKQRHCYITHCPAPRWPCH